MSTAYAAHYVDFTFDILMHAGRYRVLQLITFASDEQYMKDRVSVQR